MKRKKVTIDFETHGIERRPEYPPVPVGVAIKEYGRAAKYYAWGHPYENNCSKREARKALHRYFQNYNCIFHDASFDIEVAIVHLGLRFPIEFEDTLFLAFLYDPRSKSLSLKPMAEEFLGMPPDEQEELREWILANTDCKDTKADPWGAHIAEAPGRLVGKYAKGDVIRTEGLYRFFYDEVKYMGMLDAYEREKKVLPIFEEMSREGIRINSRQLKKDIVLAEQERERLTKSIRRRLKSKELDIDSSQQLAKALDEQGKIDQWFYTRPSKTHPNGQKSTSRENLFAGCNDKRLVNDLARYGKLGTYLSTFMCPWLASGLQYGRVFPSFNQVRSADERGKTVGTRTGRPSSSAPNFLNVPRNTDDEKYMSGLPWLRNYIFPDAGCVLNGRDYSQQEIRILAHFEKGSLNQQYKDNPDLDMHQYAMDLIFKMAGILLPRKILKTLAFGMLYGMGAKGLSKKLGIPKYEARRLKDTYLQVIPDVQQLIDDLKEMAQQDEPIVTWGGRLYWPEESKIVEGQLRNFDYKQLNYLIQGSAADITKQAMINVYEHCEHSRLMLQVYDELLLSSKKQCRVSEMKKIKEAMESVPLSVKLLSTGKWSPKSWGDMKECK